MHTEEFGIPVRQRKKAAAYVQLEHVGVQTRLEGAFTSVTLSVPTNTLTHTHSAALVCCHRRSLVIRNHDILTLRRAPNPPGFDSDLDRKVGFPALR